MREDLGSFGYQAAQASHAAIDYCMKFQPQDWWLISNRLVILTVPNEQTLFDIYQACLKEGRKSTLFCEPDRQYQATSLALEPVTDSTIDLSVYSIMGKKVRPFPCNPEVRALCEKLENSHQNDIQTIMAHGESIREASFNLMERIYGIQRPGQEYWSDVVPDSILNGPLNALIRANLHDPRTLWYYTLFHDCGKPDCLTFDDEGRRHFPRHEEVSSTLWSTLGTDTEARLMLLDMDLHRMKADGVEPFLQNTSISDIATLLVSSYSEIYANAVANSPEGIDSVSFKIKKKSLDKVTKRLASKLVL